MKKGLSRIICILAVLVMIITIMAGCGGNSTNDAQIADTSGQATANTVQESAPADGKLTNDPNATISIGTMDSFYTPASYTTNLPIFAEIEKKTGVKIKWDVVPTTQYNTVMQVRIAAGGDDLPDIVLAVGDVAKLAQDGIFIPLDDLINKYGKDIQAIYEQYPLTKALNMSDGHIYSISTVIAGSQTVTPYTHLVRKDWLDKLGLKEPETIDEWYTVLKAFKENDPNGNGKADEIPLSAPGHVWYFMKLGEAWGLHPFYTCGWYPDSNGKMQYEFIDSRYKEFLTWLNKLYKEGLIDKEFLTINTDQLKGKISRNIIGAVPDWSSAIQSYEEALKSNSVQDAHFVGTVPPKGPTGIQKGEVAGIIGAQYGITKASKNPELAMKWINYVYGTKEGQALTNFGIEGYSYTKDANGEISFTDYILKNPNKLSVQDALSAMGCLPNIPYVQLKDNAVAQLASFPERMRNDILNVSNKAEGMYESEILLPPATAEENTKINGLGSDLSTYVWEMTGKFIIGQESLDNFDGYVEKVKSLDLEQLTEVRQARYDRLQQLLK